MARKGHAEKDCWKWQRERGGKGDSKGKSKSDGKGKDGGKHSAGKGNEKGFWNSVWRPFLASVGSCSEASLQMMHVGLISVFS